MFGLAAAGAEVRRRLVVRARISRRLTAIVEPMGHLFRLHLTSGLSAMAEDADPA